MVGIDFKVSKSYESNTNSRISSIDDFSPRISRDFIESIRFLHLLTTPNNGGRIGILGIFIIQKYLIFLLASLFQVLALSMFMEYHENITRILEDIRNRFPLPSLIETCMILLRSIDTNFKYNSPFTQLCVRELGSYLERNGGLSSLLNLLFRNGLNVDGRILSYALRLVSFAKAEYIFPQLFEMLKSKDLHIGDAHIKICVYALDKKSQQLQDSSSYGMEKILLQLEDSTLAISRIVTHGLSLETLRIHIDSFIFNRLIPKYFQLVDDNAFESTAIKDVLKFYFGHYMDDVENIQRISIALYKTKPSTKALNLFLTDCISKTVTEHVFLEILNLKEQPEYMEYILCVMVRYLEFEHLFDQILLKLVNIKHLSYLLVNILEHVNSQPELLFPSTLSGLLHRVSLSCKDERVASLCISLSSKLRQKDYTDDQSTQLSELMDALSNINDNDPTCKCFSLFTIRNLIIQAPDTIKRNLNEIVRVLIVALKDKDETVRDHAGRALEALMKCFDLPSLLSNDQIQSILDSSSSYR